MTLTAFNRRRRLVQAAEAEKRAYEAQQQATQDEATDYAKLTKAQLVELAAGRGIETDGLTKAQLVEALVAHDTTPESE